MTASRNIAAARGAAALRLLAAFGSLGPRQLEALLLPSGFFSRPSRRVATSRVLGRLLAQGLVTTSDRLPGSPALAAHPRVYLLSPQGRRAYAALDPRYPLERLRPPSAVLIPHALVLAEIAIAFRETVRTRPGAGAPEWQCDWEVVALLGSTPVIPDALAVCTIGRNRLWVFVEADRATERTEAFVGKITRYVELFHGGTWRDALPVWPAVLTVTTTAVHADRLARIATIALDRARAPQLIERFRFTALDEVCRPGGFFEPIWHVPGRAGLARPVDAPDLWRQGETEAEGARAPDVVG